MKLDEFYQEIELETKKVKIGDLEFQVRQYLPLREKFQLMISIIEGAYTDSGYKSLLSYLAYNINMLDYYSDIDFNTDISFFDALDYLDETGITEAILKAIPESEKDFIKRVLQEDFKERAKKEDSLISKFSQGLEIFSKEINNLDEDTLAKAKEILATVSEK